MGWQPPKVFGAGEAAPLPAFGVPGRYVRYENQAYR